MARTPAPELKTHQRRKACADVKRTATICHLCGYPFPTVPHGHRLYLEVDEIIPRSLGGSAVERSNLAPAHRMCNGKRQARPITEQLRTECRQAIAHLLEPQRTSRNW